MGRSRICARKSKGCWVAHNGRRCCGLSSAGGTCGKRVWIGNPSVIARLSQRRGAVPVRMTGSGQKRTAEKKGSCRSTVEVTSRFRVSALQNVGYGWIRHKRVSAT